MYLIDDSRTKTGTTSGMGLAISAIILKAHHAAYGVEKRRRRSEILSQSELRLPTSASGE